MGQCLWMTLTFPILFNEASRTRILQWYWQSTSWNGETGLQLALWAAHYKSLLIQWKDGASSWKLLKDLKESNPVQVAEYAVANKVAEESVFVWWFKDVLRRHQQISSKLKCGYHKRTQKTSWKSNFKDFQEASQVDSDTGTDLWYKAIKKEMKAVQPTWKFEFLDDTLLFLLAINLWPATWSLMWRWISQTMLAFLLEVTWQRHLHL